MPLISKYLSFSCKMMPLSDSHCYWCIEQKCAWNDGSNNVCLSFLYKEIEADIIIPIEPTIKSKDYSDCSEGMLIPTYTPIFCDDSFEFPDVTFFDDCGAPLDECDAPIFFNDPIFNGSDIFCDAPLAECDPTIFFGLPFVDCDAPIDEFDATVLDDGTILPDYSAPICFEFENTFMVDAHILNDGPPICLNDDTLLPFVDLSKHFKKEGLCKSEITSTLSKKKKGKRLFTVRKVSWRIHRAGKKPTAAESHKAAYAITVDASKA